MYGKSVLIIIIRVISVPILLLIVQSVQVSDTTDVPQDLELVNKKFFFNTFSFQLETPTFAVLNFGQICLQ
jgi:hypothetical protein